MSYRLRILLAGLAIAAVLGVISYLRSEPTTPDSGAEKTALAFLAALDSGNLEELKKNSTLPEDHLRYLIANRQSLGDRSQRHPVRQEILRNGPKFGAYLEYESVYAAAPRIREALTVMEKVAVARVFFAQWPRPLPKDHHPLPLPSEALRKIVLACEAYDTLNRNFFDGMSARDTGAAQRGVFNRIRNFHKKYGVPLRRTALTSARYEKSVPGALGCSILRVTNKCVYQVKRELYEGEEVLYLVRDNTDSRPQWDVYGFDPANPKLVKSPAGKSKNAPPRKSSTTTTTTAAGKP